MKSKIGLPILPTVFTLYFSVFKIFSIILQVVDFPFVPVIVMTVLFLFSAKNISKSVVIFFKFFFKYSFILLLLISIPGLTTILSTILLFSQNLLKRKFNFLYFFLIFILSSQHSILAPNLLRVLARKTKSRNNVEVYGGKLKI